MSRIGKCPVCKGPMGFHLVLGTICRKMGCRLLSCKECGLTVDVRKGKAVSSGKMPLMFVAEPVRPRNFP